MIKKLMPVMLLIVGTGTGVGAGLMLRPAETDMTNAVDIAEGTEPSEQVAETAKPGEDTQDREYVKMSNQFVVPIVDKTSVRALVVLALSVEVTVGAKDAVFLREPKLRDSFLQVLFDHANIGGFEGEFTSNENMQALRQALREVAIKDIGESVTDVLISDIARQDY